MKAVNVLAHLPEEYYEFAPLFSQEESNKLPLHCPYDYTIPLAPGKEPPKGPLYNMSQDELLVLQVYLKDNLSKGFI